MLLNWGVGEDSWEPRGLQGELTHLHLKEIGLEYSLEGLMLKLKLQYFGHLMQRTNSFEKTRCWERLRAGEEDDRGWDGWMASLNQWTWVWASSGSWWWTGKPDELHPTGWQRARHEWGTELNWMCRNSYKIKITMRKTKRLMIISLERTEETSDNISTLGKNKQYLVQ